MEWILGHRTFIKDKIIQTKLIQTTNSISSLSKLIQAIQYYWGLCTSVYFLLTVNIIYKNTSTITLDINFSLDVSHPRVSFSQCEWMAASSEMLLLKAPSNFLFFNLYFILFRKQKQRDYVFKEIERQSLHTVSQKVSNKTQWN